MPVVTPELEEKIARRAKRAWRHHRRGAGRSFSRITEVTGRTLKYRLPGGPSHGADWYGKTKVLVRREKGEVIIETPPRDPMLTLLSEYDLKKLDDHVGRVRAFKYTTKEGKSPTRTGPEQITYKVGNVIEVKDADTSKSEDCSYGINLASQDWIKGKGFGACRVFACEFEIEDLASVPSSSDGKFRVFRCEVIEELDPETFKPLKRTKLIDAIVPVTGDPLTQPLKDRLAVRKREAVGRKQKAKKLLPAMLDKSKLNLTPPEQRPSWIGRIWKRLGL